MYIFTVYEYWNVILYFSFSNRNLYHCQYVHFIQTHSFRILSLFLLLPSCKFCVLAKTWLQNYVVSFTPSINFREQDRCFFWKLLLSVGQAGQNQTSLETFKKCFRSGFPSFDSPPPVPPCSPLFVFKHHLPSPKVRSFWLEFPLSPSISMLGKFREKKLIMSTSIFGWTQRLLRSHSGISIKRTPLVHDSVLAMEMSALQRVHLKIKFWKVHKVSYSGDHN